MSARGAAQEGAALQDRGAAQAGEALQAGGDAQEGAALQDRGDAQANVALRAIEEADLENIMRWRMAGDITRYMNTNPKLTLEGQKKWLAGIRENEDVRYWLIEVKGEPAGVINLTGLTKPDGVLGWAYYVGEQRLRSIQTALALEMSMYDYALVELGKSAVISDVFTLNKGVIQLHKICGCEVMEEKKNHILKDGVFYDVTFMRMTAVRWKELRLGKKYERIAFV